MTCMDKKKEENQFYNEICLSSEFDKCNFLSKLIYLYNWRFFYKHYKKDITISDIPKGRRIDESNYVYNEFLKYWDSELIRAKKKGRRPNLFYPIFHQYGIQLIFLSILSFLACFGAITQAFYLDDLIQSFNELNDNGNKQSKNDIIFIGSMIIFCSWIFSNSNNIYNNYTNLISLRVRVCLSEFIYRKSLLLSKNGLDDSSAGQIINLLSTDMTKIDMFFQFLSYPIVAILIIIYAVLKLWKYLRYFTFFGILYLLFALIIQSIIGVIISRIGERCANYTDERINLVTEFITAIKLIKTYCWELQFSKKIEYARKREIDMMKKSLYVYSISLSILATSIKVVVYIVLVSFYFYGGTLISDKIIFVTLSAFYEVSIVVSMYVPHSILCISNFRIAIKRINQFLTLEEKCQLNGSTGSHFINKIEDNLKKNGNIINTNKDNFNLSCKNLVACYTKNKDIDDAKFLECENSTNNNKVAKLSNVLNNINFDCKPGELIIVVGAVGSGKSSLLQTILSELKIKQGSIEVNGRLSYSSQEPWIFSGTIKENILFDSELDQKKYDKIIKICALERDLTLFQDGDMTLIGDRGITLSGGQKARINLARSLYFDADIYLLDDPLSAVDAHVAKHIFNHVINDYLKKKTVILVTHQLNYIKYADQVLFLKDGKQIFFNQGEIVMSKLHNEPDSEFAKFIGNQLHQQYPISKYCVKKASEGDLSLDTIEPPNFYDEKIELTQIKEIKKMEREKRLQEEDDKSKFIYQAYLNYFKYGHILFFGPLLLMAFLFTNSLSLCSDYLLKLWGDFSKASQFSNSTETTNITTSFLNDDYLNSIIRFINENNIYVYTFLIVLLFLTCLIRTMIFSVFCMITSTNIHKRLFKSVVHSKMTFFYSNPVGILLNRFSRDVGIVDSELVYTFYDFIELFFIEFFIVFFITISNTLLILPFLVFIICIIIFRNFYIQTARSLESLEGVAKSPIVQHLTSTLNGLVTVRALKKENKFIEKFEAAQDNHTSVHFALHTCKRWFSYILDNFVIIFIGGSFIVLITFAELFGGSLIGLIVTYIIQLSGDFQFWVVAWSNLETLLCSVDRIDQMSRTLNDDKSSLSEPALESTPECKPPKNWPQKGILKFINVTMRYYKGDEPVLKNLNFTIEEKQKIGIVGRTGAGKSSIVSALFRLTDYEGNIIIDDIDCKSIGLHDLRSKISIIPQEPILFTGTIRYNLDPFNQFNDHQLWNSLKAVQLEKLVSKELEGGLDSKITDNGGNFSVGQRQLICLARAILKENRILVIDEATANCDPKTDSLIQATIRNTFKNCTILTIAHRLNTIMDSTKILVLDAGELIEFDTPLNLLKKDTSLFRNMCYADGEEQARNLIKIAEETKKDVNNLN